MDCSACAGVNALHTKEAQPQEPVAAEGEPSCKDDEAWVDPDGHSCESYRNTISKWGLDRVCKQHHGGAGALYCRATCGTCKAFESGESSACADNACIGPWLEAYGRCFQCIDFARGCQDEVHKGVFQTECPLTCGVCKAAIQNSSTKEEEEEKEEDEEEDDDGKKDKKEEDCEDEEPEFCDDLSARYCSEGAFADRCHKTCNLCPPFGVGSSGKACVDRFSAFTCARYESYGWCTRKDTRDAVQLQCPVTCGVCGDSSVSAPVGKRDDGGSGGRRESAAKKSGAAPRIPEWTVILTAMMLLGSWLAWAD